MGISIKSPAAESLIRELAAMRGVSLVAAVTEAVEREIAREKASQPRKRKRSEVLMEFAKEYSRRAKNPIHSWEVDALLYGEDGLPK
jgi:hypothetical protein